RRHTKFSRDWSSDVCSSDLGDVRNDLARLDAAAWHLRIEDSIGTGPDQFFACRGRFADRDDLLVIPLGTEPHHAVLAGEDRCVRSEERRVGKELMSTRTLAP